MKRLSYKKSGVDITKADQFIRSIRADLAKTKSKAVMERTGAFSSLYALDNKYALASSTDGVGTKLLIAQLVGKHDTVGIDLVAMNVNDILCAGAKPLFFLDYIACGKLQPKVLRQVVRGIAKGCQQAGVSLIGGETAEMPGLYKKNEYDLAGFAVGIVEKNKIIDGSKIKAGDVLMGLPSSGIHSNGYSLVRKVFNSNEQKRFAKVLLEPTRIYAREAGLLIKRFDIKGIAHITGGAYFDKLTKILPRGKCFQIFKGAWPVPKIFQTIQNRGKITGHEMHRTFNMGIGLAFVIRRKDTGAFKRFCRSKRIKCYEIGKVINHRTKRLVL
ncbi:MAG TPA: phosphoribosylformylglycinamidine cyclo-ligase [Candidatus Omnitrophota bacterium]|nr:phosphoribosylformylglycinamidine cyclo-ligase [Candidatus Omnitrophota bacterium]